MEKSKVHLRKHKIILKMQSMTPFKMQEIAFSLLTALEAYE